jgi:hypothetical protein
VSVYVYRRSLRNIQPNAPNQTITMSECISCEVLIIIITLSVWKDEMSLSSFAAMRAGLRPKHAY